MPFHEQFRDLLGSARAESCQVVATFVDIRGFTTFAAEIDFEPYDVGEHIGAEPVAPPDLANVPTSKLTAVRNRFRLHRVEESRNRDMVEALE